MRSFGFAQDDGGFAQDDGEFVQDDGWFALNGSRPALNENLPTVILRERSEPKDLLQFTALPSYHH